MLASSETYAIIADKVGCSVQNIKYYADKYKARIKALESEYETATMQRGYANKVFRVRKLNRLANLLEREIEGLPIPDSEDGHGLWLRDVKFGPMGERVELEVFAGEVVKQYRGVLDDIAKEKGERVNKSEVELKGNILAEFTNLGENDI